MEIREETTMLNTLAGLESILVDAGLNLDVQGVDRPLN